MRGFIYKITNKINGKSYIGQTIQNVKERFYQHCATKCSQAILNMVIHKAINKYGKSNFTIEVIEEVESTNLNDRERYWIRYYDSYNNGYNSTKGGQDGIKLFKILDTESIVREYKSGKSLREIGRLFNVDKQTIKDLLVRNNINLRTTRTYKLSQKDREDIIKDLSLGLSRKEIISKWHISKGYLSQLINGYRRI
jgi:group I intron endonuclease|nr:MAG TPA: intron associated endonuclease [Crassvirales sp.]